MIVLTILSIAVIATYIGIMIKRVGVPYSISATYYTLEHKWAFGLSMLLTEGFVFLALIEGGNIIDNIVAGLACLGMGLVAIAPNFRQKEDGVIHMLGAALCGVFSQIYVSITTPYLLLLWLVFLAIIGYQMYRNSKNHRDIVQLFLSSKPMFWVEITALISTYSCLLIKWI